VQPKFTTNQMDAHRLLAQLASGRVTMSYRNNEKIFNQGDGAAHVFFVQEGCVQLTALSEHDAVTVVGTAREGQFFGEACLHDVPVRLATATSVGHCRITSITNEAMLFAVRDRPKFAKLFVDYLSDRNPWVEKSRLDHLLNFRSAFPQKLAPLAREFDRRLSDVSPNVSAN
jgi:CRP/FNR family transcriptional regulator, cyclic AMP receptor protein